MKIKSKKVKTTTKPKTGANTVLVEVKKGLTKTELIAKLKALGKISIEQKKQIACSLIGHSRIIETCFGYVHCARCGDQIGDALGGYFDGSKNVIVGHKCDICVENEKTLTWQDRYLAKSPF